MEHQLEEKKLTPAMVAEKEPRELDDDQDFEETSFDEDLEDDLDDDADLDIDADEELDETDDL